MAGGQLAEWWQRALAVFLDGIMLAVVGGIIAAVLGFDDGLFDPGRRLLDLVLGLAYFGMLNGSAKGQTLGKTALNISVRDIATGGSIGEGRGLLRYFVSYVLWITCVLGIVDALFPLWDKQRQSIHDKAASSVVVKV